MYFQSKSMFKIGKIITSTKKTTHIKKSSKLNDVNSNIQNLFKERKGAKSIKKQ